MAPDPAFFNQLAMRLPLASAALELFDFAFDPSTVEAVYAGHRGRSYTNTLYFGDFLTVIRDCLLVHHSGQVRFSTRQRPRSAATARSGRRSPPAWLSGRAGT